MDTKKLIIICITIIAIVGIGLFTFLSLHNNNEITYVNENFDGFSMNVPNGTLFKKVDLTDYGQQEYIGYGNEYLKMVAYKNKGNYSENITGIFYVKTSLQYGLKNVSGNNVSREDSPFGALYDHIFPMGEKLDNKTGEIYVNTSDTLISGYNTTSGKYYGAIKSDNEHTVLMVGGNNLDIVTNATESLKFS